MSIAIRECVIESYQYEIFFYLDPPRGNILSKQEAQFFVAVLVFKIWSCVVLSFVLPANVAKSSLPHFVLPTEPGLASGLTSKRFVMYAGEPPLKKIMAFSATLIPYTCLAICIVKCSLAGTWSTFFRSRGMGFKI